MYPAVPFEIVYAGAEALPAFLAIILASCA
jgi:hypothetical protein